jgi:DnaJ-class molecular chaperone
MCRDVGGNNFFIGDCMQVVLLGQERDSNYVDLVEFCSSRGIKLVEEKFTSTNKPRVEICPQCGGSGVPKLQLRFAEVCPVCKGTGKLSPVG